MSVQNECIITSKSMFIILSIYVYCVTLALHRLPPHTNWFSTKKFREILVSVFGTKSCQVSNRPDIEQLEQIVCEN